MECPSCGVDKDPSAFRKGRVCKACEYQRQLVWKANNRERDLARRNKWRQERTIQIRADAIAALGGKCAWCGIADARVLDIDHVNGGGGKDRKKRDRVQIMLSIIGDPTGFQLLCCNCHRIKTLGGNAQGGRRRVVPGQRISRH